jgi:hypothetical protein
MAGMKRRRRVLVSPEFGIDLPLWNRSPEGFGVVDDVDVGISVQLAARLREWNARWEAHPPEQPRRWSAQDEYQWVETGYRLARQLQSELPDVEVLILDSKGREVPISEAR